MEVEGQCGKRKKKNRGRNGWEGRLDSRLLVFEAEVLFDPITMETGRTTELRQLI